LDGSLGARAKAAQFAGCDVVLHCNGKMDEMKQVAAETKALNGQALKRAFHALSLLELERADAAFEPGVAEARLKQLLAEAP
jgi:beta-N-acetylhexosaminidase